MKSKTLKRVQTIIKPHIKTIIIVTFLAIITNIGEIIKPYLIKIVIDNYLNAGIYQKGIMTIGIIGAIYIAIVIIGNIIDFIARTTTNIMGEEVIYTIRNKLYRYIQKANITFHDKTSTGSLFVKITNDVEEIATLFKEVIATFLKDIILIISLVGVIIYLSFQLSIYIIILMPFAILMSYILTKILKKAYRKSKEIRTKLNIFLAESIYGIKLIKIFNCSYEKQKECEDLTEKYLESRKITGIIKGMFPSMMMLFENIGITLIICACTKNWMGVNIDVGLVFIFITYIKQIFEPINRIVENMEIIQESIVSINKIYDVLDQKEYLEDLNKGIKLEKIKGKIEFKNVWFSYDNKNWILKDISFIVEAGQSIALCGKTGSGKTTITNLINRFYEIQKGEILIDGINIKDINIRSLRTHIGIILQEPFIFARSIKDNISLNNNISDEEIEKAIKLSSSEDFINSMPNGINEKAIERGESYSLGEKQLISFARIFAHDPSIFILDEATANIDTHTEILIQKSVDKISEDKTSIFIAHRLSTIVNVDKIIVLDKGKILESGNHNELLKTEGYYSKLYQSYYNQLA